MNNKKNKSSSGIIEILRKSKEKRKLNSNQTEKSSKKKLNLNKNMVGYFKNFLSKQIDENIKKYIFCKLLLISKSINFAY